jgi:hypothetical protein
MDTRLSLLAGVAVAYGAMAAGLARLPLPQSGAQVPATWRYRFPKPVTAALYGAVLGTGIGTQVSSAAFVGVLGAAALLGSPAMAAVVMGTYGVIRAFAVVVASTRAGRECGEAMLFGYRWAPLWRAVGVLQMSVLAGATLGVLMSR